MNISLPGREAESINPLKTARSSDPRVISNYFIHMQGLAACVACSKTHTELLGPMNRYFLNNKTAKQQQQTARKLQVDFRGTSVLLSNRTFPSAVQVCLLGCTKQVPPAKTDSDPRRRKHQPKRLEETLSTRIRSHAELQNNPVNIFIHKINHQPPDALPQFQDDVLPC